MDRLNSNVTNNHDVGNGYLFNNKLTEVQDGIKEKHNAYVTKLDANHYPDRGQNKYINEMIYKLKHTDSISEHKRLIIEIKKCMGAMQQELNHLREITFILKNEGTHEVYGILAKNFTSNDRDVYIKNLSNYYDVIIQLSEMVDDENHDNYGRNLVCYFGSNQRLAMEVLDGWSKGYPIFLHHSNPLYGDLSAMSNLHHGICAEIPDLAYNRGREQFG